MDSCKQIYKYLLKQNTQVVELITRNRLEFNRKKKIIPIINQYVNGEWSLGSCSDFELTILVKTSENANRLRYNSQQLLNDIRKLELFNKLREIKIRLAPDSAKVIRANKPTKKKSINYSSSGGKDLEILAESIGDQGLKTSLLRLANHLRK